MRAKVIYFILILAMPLCLAGCQKNDLSTYLGRTNISGSGVVDPFSGILARMTTAPNIVWANPDTSNTIDVVFGGRDDLSDSNPTYRYFQYAEGLPIPAYKVGEGVNVTIDGTYHGDASEPVIGDTNPATMLVPLQSDNSSGADNITYLTYNEDRWSAQPETYTISADYLEDFVFGPTFDIDVASYNQSRPAILLILYEPAEYYSLDANTRSYSSEPMYFDAYYSIDYWNALSNNPPQVAANVDIATTNISSPEDYGVCQYTYSQAGANTITIQSNGQNTSGVRPFLLGSFCEENPSPGLANPNPSSSYDDDIYFTLITSHGNDSADSSINQSAVNLWTKYDFISMLLGNTSTTFKKASNAVTSGKVFMPKKSSYAEQNNLEVPKKLYSKAAFEANLLSTCCNGDERCAYNASWYDVSFSAIDTIYYHNRSAIVDSVLYERQPPGKEGARSQSDNPQWPWCWFAPE